MDENNKKILCCYARQWLVMCTITGLHRKIQFLGEEEGIPSIRERSTPALVHHQERYPHAWFKASKHKAFGSGSRECLKRSRFFPLWHFKPTEGLIERDAGIRNSSVYEGHRYNFSSQIHCGDRRSQQISLCQGSHRLCRYWCPSLSVRTVYRDKETYFQKRIIQSEKAWFWTDGFRKQAQIFIHQRSSMRVLYEEKKWRQTLSCGDDRCFQQVPQNLSFKSIRSLEWIR